MAAPFRNSAGPFIVTVILVVGVLSLLSQPCSWAADNHDAKIMFHLTAPISKSACSNPIARPTCAGTNTAGLLYPTSFNAYLLVTDGDSPTGIAAMQFGIQYDGAPGVGVDLYSWTHCGNSELPGADWPQSGSGNSIIWTGVSNCQRTEPGGVGSGVTAIGGYFYCAAYTPGALAIVPSSANGTLLVADCASQEYLIGGAGYSGCSRMGTVVFTASGTAHGYNPCDCAMPATPSNPSPSDQAVDVGENIQELQWNPDVNATSYDVYFGTSPNPPFVANVSTNSWSLHGIGTPAMEYFWRVTAHSRCCEVNKGPLWSFTVECDPPQLTSWPSDPSINLPVCTVASSPELVVSMTADEADGAFVVWQDWRNGKSLDLYAQHVLASGTMDPSWCDQGRPVCTASNDQYDPQIVADEAGGAFVSWSDLRDGVFDVYAHRLGPDGMAAAGWAQDGLVVSNAPNDQVNAVMTRGGHGDAFIFWEDYRANENSKVFGHHLLPTGLDPTWPEEGRRVSTTGNFQLGISAIPDGQGGSYVAWHDFRPGFGRGTYLQRVLATGLIHPSWPDAGLLLAGEEAIPFLVLDRSEALIVAWGNSEIRVQRVLAAGLLDPQWPAAGVLVTENFGAYPMLISDNAGGAFVAYVDFDGSSALRVDHVLAAGVHDPAWPVEGVELAQYASIPSVVPDGSGGMFFGYPLGGDDIYAQHLLATGAIDPAWPAAGRPVSYPGQGVRYNPVIVQSGAGVILAWPDSRLGPWNVYAQQVGPCGFLGDTSEDCAVAVELSAFDVQWEGSAAVLRWTVPESHPGGGFHVHRGPAAASRVQLTEELLSGEVSYVYSDLTAPAEGCRYWLAEVDRTGSTNWHGPINLPAAPRVEKSYLAAPAPNPFAESTRIGYALSREGSVRLSVVSIDGRIVRHLIATRQTAGAHEVSWDGCSDSGARVSTGIYLISFELDSERLVRKVSLN